ncbi:rhomboid family intramembrane serine protease [Segetibacter aerophilus]|uniref:Rhomboid family intramembrane serine protease n=1 Tax=Segetibacter aerophilus TaxID=670293 RepID=A0A512B7M4_9BACT|nr:rhomboid family intramembrane serine protease [Segetibacter aerophilus]GEO07919.1 rhomboid family intramembrane serine protease [Segetibacter aerophilus]
MNITLIIVIITSVISFSAFSNPRVTEQMIFYPPAITNQNQWYRFFSCALIHADPPHLLFNMFSLYSFGGLVEENFKYLFGSLGPILYVALYVISQFLCLLPTFSKHKNDYSYRSLGASGAVSAVIFAGIFLNPLVKLSLLFIPIGIPGFIFGFLYLGVTVYLDRKGGGSINHSAHLFGAIAGIGLLVIFGYAFSQYDLFQNFIAQIKSFSF